MERGGEVQRGRARLGVSAGPDRSAEKGSGRQAAADAGLRAGEEHHLGRSVDERLPSESRVSQPRLRHRRSRDRVAKEARYHEMQTARPETIADTLSNGLVTGLRSDLSRLERDYAEKLNLYKPEWPAMQQLQTQIDKSREHLDVVIRETVTKARDSAKNDYETAVRRESSLKTALVPQRSEVQTSNTNAVEYNNLRLDLEAKRQLLDSLLKQEAQTEVTSRLRGEHVSNARIVDRALPDWAPFKPSYKKNIALALFGGLALGVGLALFLSYMDRSLRSVEDVARHLQPPGARRDPGVVERFGPALPVRGKTESQDRRGRGRGAGRDRVAAADAAAVTGGGGLPGRSHVPASFPRRRREIHRGHLVRAPGRQEHDRGEPGRRHGAARQARPARGRGSPQAAAARDLPSVQPGGPRLDPRGGRGIGARHREDHGSRGLSRPGGPGVSESVGPAVLRGDVEVPGACTI